MNAPKECDESCRNASKKGGSLWSVGPLVVDRPVVVIWDAGRPPMVNWPAVKRLRWCVAFLVFLCGSSRLRSRLLVGIRFARSNEAAADSWDILRVPLRVRTSPLNDSDWYTCFRRKAAVLPITTNGITIRPCQYCFSKLESNCGARFTRLRSRCSFP
jgi:hypothetical protein